MDTFKTFMNIFERAVVERNSKTLTEILKSSRKYFQNVARDESELLLSVLFDENKGLLSFLDNELQKSPPQKGFDAAIKEAFYLLEFVIEQFADLFEAYIISAKNTCQLALKTKCSALIQKAACCTFNKLIELFSEYEIELGDTIKEFVSLFRLVHIKERSMLFSVLGMIMKYNPEIPESKEYSYTIYQQLRNDFKQQYNPQAMSCSIDIFQVYLDALTNLLNNVSSKMKKQDIEQLYEWVKELSHPEKYSVKKVSMRSAVNLLSRHIYIFEEFVYKDYQYWHDLLINLTQDKNAQNSECGQYALKNYYRMIANTLKNKTSDDDKSIFLYFKVLFEDQLKLQHHVNASMLRFIIYGFSQMAAPCKRYLTNDDVKNMFSLIANSAMPLCAKEDLDKERVESICDYEEALSEIILHTSYLSIDQINIITKLSILLIKRFPDLPIVSRNRAISSLICTIINIGITSKNLLDEFLYNLTYNGVIWTCSNMLLIDAELKRGLENLSDRPKCYKDYLPLWLQILEAKRYKKHSHIVQQVVDTMINVGVTIINKLNLNRNTKKDNVFSDAALSQIAENETDFAMFVNIVDLYVDIINKLESSLFVNTIQKYLLNVITMSYKHSLISGFYKLVHASFKHICNLSKDDIDTDILEMLYKYLMNLLNLITTFSNELLTTCLYLMLNVPIKFVERFLDNTIPMFKIAFTVGLSEFELACAALNSLEKWTYHFDKKNTKIFLHEIIPFLEPYLQSGESCVEFLQDIIKTERKVIKKIVLRDDENNLEKFQMKVLLFISSLDTDIITAFIHRRSMNVGATWDKKDLLQYSLTFSDVNVNVYFDKFLPRLSLLAQNSGDRRTKIIACEVLHSITAFVLGKTSQHLTSNPDRLVPAYVSLYPALLHLGCDYDEAARQIFQPFVLQLTHWLSSKFMLKSPATMYFLDSLFESLNDDSNSSIREFSGMCLAEFTEWSIKQSGDEKDQTNIHEVISKITNFALHPFVSKRIAAATAFNHLYAILREDETIVSVYWLEILYCFVKSLDGCSDPSIIAALDHIERVLTVKKNLLNAEHHGRRKPPEFEGANLKCAVNWLLTQCGCFNRRCRTKCMNLFAKLAEYVAGCDSAQTMINNYIQSHGIDMFHLIILNGLQLKIEGLSTQNLLPLLRSLDCYVWLIKSNLLDAQCLFGIENTQREVIFNCVKNFVYVMKKIKVENKERDFVIPSKELEHLQTLQCQAVLTIFDFLQILLNLDDNVIPDFLLNKDLFQLIAKCIMSPQKIGLDTNNLEIVETLPSVMEKLLQSLTLEKNNYLLHLIEEELSTYVELHIKDFIDLNRIITSTDDYTNIKEYVRGLKFLKNHNILNRLRNVNELTERLEDKVKRIFDILAMECMGEQICAYIKPPAKDYLDILINFLLMDYEPSMTEMLITLMENDRMLGPDSKKIEHGMHFLNLFKQEIFNYMLKDAERSIQIFIDTLQKNPSLFLLVVEQLFLFMHRHKKNFQDRTELLANAVIKNFKIFENIVNNMEDRKQKLISIYRIAVHLKQTPTEILSLSEDLYSWILNQLTENSDLEYKIRILQDFLICLADMTSGTKPELLSILRSLKNNRLGVTLNDFSQGTVKATIIMNCFQTLASLLPITKSVTVLETVILFAAGVAKHLCNAQTDEYFKLYFASITTDYVLESLQSIFVIFMNQNSATNERFDVLKSFLLPSFEFCRNSEIHLFFKRNIKQIYNIIRQAFIGNVSDISQLILSKIGCYDLVAIMFAKIHIRDIDDSDSEITRNAIDDVVTGKELLQSLYSNVLNVRMLKAPEPEHKETMRLLHCSAYNCSIAIVSSLKKDEDSYVSIFAENRKKGQLIWENIVDCQKRYNFQQTVKEYPKYSKKLINIREGLKQRDATNNYSYIYNYDLSTCTLNEDIYAYDFNNAVIHKKPNNVDKEESMSLIFEDDDLNNHECMPLICGVLKHIISEGISSLSTDDDIVTPKWLKCFLNSMVTADCDNVRLFMLRVVLNMQTVFKPYAKVTLQPIMRAVYLYLKRNQLNYIINDAIEMLIDWQMSLPKKSKEAMLNEKSVVVQQFWEIIIHKTIVKKTSEISKSVYKYNMNMAKTILEVWHAYLNLPTSLSDKMKNAPGAAVYLILICIVNGMENDIIQREDILDFLQKSLENWQDDEETVLQCYECYGLILKHLDTNEALANKKCAIMDKIHSILRQMQTRYENRQVKCIRALCKNYPAAGMIFFEFVTTSMFKVDSQGKSNCLEIFLLCIPNLTVDQILKELSFMKFHDLLRNKTLTCEEVALKIINSLIPILPPANISSLIDLVPLYTKHESSEYREIAYNIFKGIYKRYSTDNPQDDKTKELLQTSTTILIHGILDPAESLQDMIFTFWTQEAQLKNTYKERLLEILNTYTPKVGQTFLPFTFLLILDLTKKLGSYTQTLFEPLHDCSYRDYKIALSWRTKNLGSKAPLFAPSLASQMNQMFSQASPTTRSLYSDFTRTRSNYNSNFELELRATREAEFEPTFAEEQSIAAFSDLEEYDTFKVPKVPEPAYNKRSRRFLSSASDLSETIRQKEIKKNIRRAEMIKEEGSRQRGSVKLYRKYRIGDFPDIEISHATIIEPLQQLAKKDQLICKDLIVSIVCSLLANCERDSFVEKLAGSIKNIVENEQESNSTITAVLEIILNTRITNCSAEAVARVSRFNSLNFLGSLVLEESLIYGTNDSEPLTKKRKTEVECQSPSEWLHLTNLYESMNDIDTVLSIFQNHVANEYMHTASFAQASNNWSEAKAAYEKAYETGAHLIKEHCLQGLFDCLSNMCCWNEIEGRIKSRLNGQLDNIWNDPGKDWLFPWFFETQVRKVINKEFDEELDASIEVMQSWLCDDEKVKHFKRFFGEESSMLFINDEADKIIVAREFLLNTLDEMRLQWMNLNPLSTQIRIRKLQKLRVVNDIDKYLKILKNSDAHCNLKEILNFWNNSMPSTQDAIMPWDKLTTYRTYFIGSCLSDNLNVLQGNAENVEDDDESEIQDKLNRITLDMRMKMIETALDQRNKYIAIKYLCQLEKNEGHYPKDVINQFFLTGARIKYLCGDVETDTKKKLSNYTSSWKSCQNLLQKNDLDAPTTVKTHRQMSYIATKISQLSEEDESFAQMLADNDVILKGLDVDGHDLCKVREALETCSFNHLKASCDTVAANIEECYFDLAKYCYEKLSHGTENVQLSKEFVRSVLKAMNYGSLKAAHYFPCLLKPEYFNDEETRGIFVKETEDIQTWLFLSWQAQLFSNLGTSISTLIIPILKRIVETYPNAVIYTFRLTVETNPALLNDANTYEIRKILYSRPDVDRFLLALEYVVQPELYLQHYLVEFVKNLSLGPATTLDILLKKVYPTTSDNKDDPKPGYIFNEIVKYKSKIRELAKGKPEDIKLKVAKIIENIKESLQKRKDRYKLKDYSPWLTNYSLTDIEVPGQYTGDRKPMPRYHTKIIKFEPTVKVMQSIRKPIRITMIGNDAKEYHFLVKFGEDLRQDQRLQQLFSILNKTLETNAACRQRQLFIDTYQVIPLSRTLGLIQWINNTRSLQELIHFTLSKDEINRYDSIPKQYQEWVRKAAPSKKSYEWYQEVTVKYSASSVISKMTEFITKTKWDSLRKTLVILCSSVESFVTMRRNFITSYATMCTAHWIFGIGDRHLQNTLVVIDSGRCLGIDFGLAFDAGVDQRIPELMPFRLTSQIMGLLKPFTEKDLFATIMIHVLRAIRNEQGPIVSCMDVFVHEPLNWTEHVNKAIRENANEDVTDMKWVPLKKITAVKKKLSGIKPSLITIEQLKEQHNDKYFDKYCAIVSGEDNVNRVRATMKNNFLTPEEQIECLLDQATDLNILGHTFVGWKSWL